MKYLILITFVLFLCGLAAFVMGGLYARFMPYHRKSLLLFGLIALVLLFLPFLISDKALPVSGEAVQAQVMAFIWELLSALLAGYLFVVRRTQQKKPSRGLIGITLFLCLFFYVAQLINVNRVLAIASEAGLLKPQDDYKPEINKDCPANLQSLYNAFEQYAELNDKLPDAPNWEDNTDLTSRIPQDEWLHCPVVSNRHDAHFGYALNDALTGKTLNLNGKPLKTLPNANTTPLLYDSTNLNKNAHDAAKSVPKPGRHGGRNNILYLDGHVAAIAPK